ncbi:MAG TPA: hypothetical protein VNZ44_04180, partial [Pyrinomonadaceae bacterium]|nr:hypothetical protein [Pyrinomonadaceae bacterium]
PFTVNSVFDVNRDGNLTDRLDTAVGLVTNPVEGDESVRLGLAPGTAPSSLLAPDGRDGALGRNSFRARGLVSFDLALAKLFEFRDEQQLQFRVEVFNLFNRANFAIPERLLEAPAFGRSTRTVTPARTIQLQLRYSF